MAAFGMGLPGGGLPGVGLGGMGVGIPGGALGVGVPGGTLPGVGLPGMGMPGVGLPAAGLAGVMPHGKKQGMFAEAGPWSKSTALQNPEYQSAFRMFDRDGSGTIDLMELGNALTTVKASVEGGTMRTMYSQPFNFGTVVSLAGRFAGHTGVIGFPQFAEMLLYLESVKSAFKQIDCDNSGDLSVSELSRAFSLSGFHVTGCIGGGDMLSIQVTEKIGRAYDADGNGVLTFDEFVQLRIEWDSYLMAWDTSVAPGMTWIDPRQLYNCLEAIKKSLEPIGALAMSPMVTGMQGYNMNMFSGLYFNSQFQVARHFDPRTCEMLIIRFGSGDLRLTFEQFCLMMEFLKDMKNKFMASDTNRNGSLDLRELHTAFLASGLPLPAERVMMLARRYDADNDGVMEFDEFLQMMIEWTQVSVFQPRIAALSSGRATARDVQQFMGGIRMNFCTYNGVIPTMRPFSLHTCRMLVAMHGSPMPGEVYASSVSYPEFLILVQHVKQAYWWFAQSDMTGSGNISPAELQICMARSGLNLPPMAIQAMIQNCDIDHSGTIEFDEFLHMLSEATMYQNQFSSLGHLGINQAQLYGLVYGMPRLHRVTNAMGMPVAGTGMGVGAIGMPVAGTGMGVGMGVTGTGIGVGMGMM